MSFSAPVCVIGPCPFDNTITLENPFKYHTSDGNLLLDVTVPTAVLYVQFDSVFENPIMQRVWNDGNATADTGEIADDTGLVTQFVCEPIPAQVPTLSEWGLMVIAVMLGIIGFMVMKRRKVNS